MNLKFVLSALIITLVQVVFGNFFPLSHLITVALLPAVVISLPMRISTPWALVLAFILALLSDLFTDGVLGLSAAALLPVALTRLWTVRVVFGRDVVVRGEDISIQRQGIAKMLLALVISCGLYLCIFIWIDGAGMRAFSFNLLRFILSLAASSLLGLIVVNILTSERSTRWR